MTDLTLTHLMAASALLVSAEKIASMGVLPENEEAELRRLIIRVCGAFQLESKAERGDSKHIRTRAQQRPDRGVSPLGFSFRQRGIAMNKKRLLKLADLLEADAKNKKGIKFDLGVIAVKAGVEWYENNFAPGENPTVDCGTAACAVGLACISGAFKRQGLSYKITKNDGIQPSYKGMNKWGAEARFFGLTKDESDFLFQPFSYGAIPKGARGERQVAKRIRNFVAGKVSA